MAAVQDPELPGVAGDATTGGTPPRRRPRRIVLALLAVAVAVPVGVHWRRSALAAEDRRAVWVVTDADALSCEGTTVEHVAPGVAFPGPAVPTATIAPGMRCAYRFWVRNAGDATVALEQVRFPVLGPAAGAAVEAIALDPAGAVPSPTEEFGGVTGDAVAAVFDVDLHVAPNDQVELTLHLVHRPNGCNVGVTLLFPDAPTLRIRSRGVTGERSPESLGFGLFGPVDRECPSALGG